MTGKINIEFMVNDEPVVLSVPPLLRLLDILRDNLGLTGTKEGCGEGECGACAVFLDDRLVNSCLVPAFQLGGSRVRTIESLSKDGQPDPIQTAYVEAGAVQCGFCFPGMVMATRNLLDQNSTPNRDEIRQGLAGNLCRCTGYERIIKAVEDLVGQNSAAEDDTAPNKYIDSQEASAQREKLSPGLSSAIQRCGQSEPSAKPIIGKSAANSGSLAPTPAVDAYLPADLPEALALLEKLGQEATLIAGATDFLISVKLGHPVSGSVIDITLLVEQVGIEQVDDVIEIGACTTFADLTRSPLISKRFPSLITCSEQVGAVAIQNRATLGGNLISASPAADSPPVLMALGAIVRLASKSGERDIPLVDFYTGYRQTVKRSDELLRSIHIPIPLPGTEQEFYKISTRKAMAIAKVSLGASAIVDRAAGLTSVFLAAGSVAATPVLLPKAQAWLEGRPIKSKGSDRVAEVRALAAEAGKIAAAEVKPIDDVRSTAEYRQMVTGELVRRFVEEVLA